jgi:hypothetical protein
VTRRLEVCGERPEVEAKVDGRSFEVGGERPRRFEVGGMRLEARLEIRSRAPL